MNNAGILLGCNDKVLKDLELNSLEEYIGKHSDENSLPEAWQNSLKVIETGKPYICEEEHIDSVGNKIVYLSIKHPIKNNEDKVIGLIGISVDITQRKNQERAVIEAKIKAESEAELRQAVMILTGSIVHDLKTPIAGLAMKASALQTYWPVLIDAYRKAKAAQLPIEGDDWELAGKLELMAGTGKSFEETTRQMQAFIDATLKTLSKAMRGTLPREDLTSCSIWRCILNTLNYYPFADGEYAWVKWKQDYHFNFMGNELLLIRVLLNLLNNALYQIKQCQRGQITISTEDGGDVNLLKFKDTASGAAPEIVAHLFDGYHTTKACGSGVGLAFCKLTMKSFGGDIVCHSVQGEYMEFTLSFPKLDS